MDEQIPIKQKILPKNIFKISRMKQEIKATNPHKHDHYHELIFLSSGEGFHTIDLEKYIVQPPQLFLVKAGQVHHWQFTSIPRGYVVIFRSDFMMHLDFSSTISSFKQLQRSFFNLKEYQANSFNAVFEQMEQEYQREHHQHSKIIASFLEVVLARMIRLSHQAEQKPADSGAKLVNRYRKLIQKHLTECHLVKEYAEQLHVSPKHLNEICNQVTDKTASKLLTESMLLEAKRRLLHTSKTVAEVAYGMGFSDPSNFSTFFKRHTATPPGAFRKSML